LAKSRAIVTEFGNSDDMDSHEVGKQQSKGAIVTPLGGWDMDSDLPPPDGVSDTPQELRAPSGDNYVIAKTDKTASDNVFGVQRKSQAQRVIEEARRVMEKNASEAEVDVPGDAPGEISKLSADNPFLDRNVSPKKLYGLLNDKFGAKWLGWEPESLLYSINDEYGTHPDPVVSNKIMALKVLLKSDEPWESWNVFEKIAVAFNHRIPNFALMDYLSPSEINRAIKSIGDIRDDAWGDEVMSYIAAVCHEHGLSYLPEGLKIAQDKLDELGNDTTVRDAIKARLETLDLEALDAFEVDEDDPVDIGLARTIVIIRESK
jgi:hypothetical protein